jgi:hypothetical protein
VGPTAVLYGCGHFLPPSLIRSPDLSARSESLYQLSDPSSRTLPIQSEINIFREGPSFTDIHRTDRQILRAI